MLLVLTAKICWVGTVSFSSIESDTKNSKSLQVDFINFKKTPRLMFLIPTFKNSQFFCVQNVQNVDRKKCHKIAERHIELI
jgi:hypothetical protein